VFFNALSNEFTNFSMTSQQLRDTSGDKLRISSITSQLPPSVRLIAVSKTVPAEIIRVAYAAGIRDFGENRIQETAAKQVELADLPDITWHLIGNIQSNKAKKALQLFPWIHSVDSLAIAQRLDTLAAELKVKPQICLQVKILPDPTKFGWSPTQLLADLPALKNLNNLQFQGLMTIPPVGLDDSQIIDVFNNTSILAQQLKLRNFANMPMTELSMGMSGDYHLAIDAGATMVRLGTILFGTRA
jgi:PLP dependent protein